MVTCPSSRTSSDIFRAQTRADIAHHCNRLHAWALDEQVTNYFKGPSLRILKTPCEGYNSCHCEPKCEYMHEDQLPKDMPQEHYDRWHTCSAIFEGVRVGPLYPECQRIREQIAEEGDDDGN